MNSVIDMNTMNKMDGQSTPITNTITVNSPIPNRCENASENTSSYDEEQVKVVIPLEDIGDIGNKNNGERRRRRKKKNDNESKNDDENENDDEEDEDEKKRKKRKPRMGTRLMYLVVSVIAVIFLIFGAACFPVLGKKYSCGDVGTLGLREQAVCHGDDFGGRRSMVARVSGDKDGAFGVKAFVGGLPRLSNETVVRRHSEEGVRVEGKGGVSFRASLVHGSRVEYRAEVSRAASLYVVRYRDYIAARRKVYWNSVADFYEESLVRMKDFSVCGGEFYAVEDDLYVFAVVNEKSGAIRLKWDFNITQTMYDIFGEEEEEDDEGEEEGGEFSKSYLELDDNKDNNGNKDKDNNGNDVKNENKNDNIATTSSSTSTFNSSHKDGGVAVVNHSAGTCDGHETCVFTVNSSVYLVVYNSAMNTSVDVSMGLYYPDVFRYVLTLGLVCVPILTMFFLVGFMIITGIREEEEEEEEVENGEDNENE